MGLLDSMRALVTGGTTLLVDGGMTAGYLQRERSAPFLIRAD